ncbi:MAG: type II toxin-antitoxin system PemK/MazF family toxin [Rhodoglobus sp.]
MNSVRGDIHELRTPKGGRGHEQAGSRFAVVIQSDDLILSTLLVAPTSRSARPRVFRPMIVVAGEPTRVLIEQSAAVAPERLGRLVGHLSRPELDEVASALRLVLELD